MASSGVSTSSWSKWQIALVVGAPVALGIGYWYLKQNASSIGQNNDSSSSSKSKQSSLLGTGDQTSIDTEGLDSVNSAKTLPENPLERALYHKDAGNQHFKAGKYDEAIKCYNEAIGVCPTDKRTDLATFYQNRAAAYEQLKLYKEVREDCTRALDLNPKYVKALQRRAKACELTHDLQQSLEDVTAACILEGFQNQSNLLTADRVLKELGRQHAKEAMASRKAIMPSKQFIKTFFSSFIEDPIKNSMSDKNESDSAEADIRGFARAKQAFVVQDYDDIIPACTDEINSESAEYKNEALVLRGTFHLLLGQHDAAFKDFEAVINNPDANVKLRVNALIKRASLHMQLEQPVKSLEDFNLAAQLDPNNSDVYHHRGQVHLLMEKMNEAMDDFNKAVTLNPNFPIAYVQKCYTDYRHAFQTRNMEKMEEVMNEFRRAVERFPTCSECHTLFAQVLSDQQDYERADQYYRKAIEVEPENATLYVHRGLLQLQSTGDINKAIELISKALKMDDRCEFAYETLGTIEVQRGNLKRAVELFDKAIPLAKTEIEMSHLFSLRDAAIAQATVAERMGISIASGNQN
ncbi:mitochondrial import receptor subunit TOM70 [Schistocerca americana]|uniref:mitochondrial import receptor subunit TOM70 n=1 Tax=Schistocerca americana TaxID=7009 RepID=UPI001F4F65AD|nr:mitochondrial import receptor subunit TOM70 [Schistocerca americana]XP_047119747.1 mitochondrial import receptor subunit TOM70 [Schistocerca piceifrons]XP_049764010.1 mitochondrial import receptor subunit TOM70 [Schistocerca cancellata]XP_049940514.1 mitochondrial import receptor subunit TOM70 [Schistocerca serialis cubense]